MFSIEHDFDATVVTLMDEGESPLQEDVVLTAFEEVVQVEQYDPRSDSIQKISISMAVIAFRKSQSLWRSCASWRQR